VIRVSVEGLDRVRHNLEQMRGRSTELSAAWEEFLTWWAVTNVEQFASRGARWRTPWAPLTPSTVIQKRHQGFLSEPLVRTTSMRSELTRRPLGVEHIRAHEVEAGTDISYARFHQSGTRRMKARKLVNARQVAAEGAASSAVLTWILDGVPNTGGSRKLER
jgi:hypothetical protein